MTETEHEKSKVIPMPGGVSTSALPTLLEVPPDFFPELTDDARRASFFAEQQGEYTGDRFFSQRPEDYREIVSLRGKGVSLRKIAERLKPCSVNTVRAVLKREAGAVDTRRDETVSALDDFILDGAERLRDEKLPIGQVALAMGIAIDKRQLLTGGATVRVEVVEPVKPLDLDEYLDTLPNVSEMGLGTDDPGTKRAPAEGATSAILGAGECESLGPTGLGLSNDTLPDTQATVRAVNGASNEGGRGSENAPHPATEPIHSPESGTHTKDP